MKELPSNQSGHKTVIAKLARVAGVAAVVLLLLSMYATEMTRLFVHELAPSPMPLPRHVDIRYSDRIVAIIGRGTPTGMANAVTLGYTIVVPKRFGAFSLPEQKRIITHELVHVEQRKKYWRFYLPLYGMLYVARGYSDHPFERGGV